MPKKTLGEDKSEVKKLRRQAGFWLKTKRQSAGLTQKDLAKTLQLEYYTFISQIESGHGRVPSALFQPWAQALDIPAETFAQKMLEFYDPHTFVALGFHSNDPLVQAIAGGHNEVSTA